MESNEIQHYAAIWVAGYNLMMGCPPRGKTIHETTSRMMPYETRLEKVILAASTISNPNQRVIYDRDNLIHHLQTMGSRFKVSEYSLVAEVARKVGGNNPQLTKFSQFPKVATGTGDDEIAKAVLRQWKKRALYVEHAELNEHVLRLLDVFNEDGTKESTLRIIRNKKLTPSDMQKQLDKLGTEGEYSKTRKSNFSHQVVRNIENLGKYYDPVEYNIGLPSAAPNHGHGR